jgi:hypothetical protein
MVEGGTSWAINLFRLLKPSLPIYMYEQSQKEWIIENSDKLEKPSGIYTGIGTRKIDTHVKTVIKELYDITT